MSSANPITRSTRRRDLDATAGQTVFTLDVYVYDLADVEVFTKLATATQWTQIFTGFTLALIAGNQVQATFTVPPRASIGDPQISVRLQSARVQERITNATRGGTVSSSLLEQDLDRIATVLQELRRDVDEASDASAIAGAAASAQAASSSAAAASASANAAASSAAAAATFNPSLYVTNAALAQATAVAVARAVLPHIEAQAILSSFNRAY